MNQITNDNFKSKVIGYDPISKGTFIIEYAYFIFEDEWEDSLINGCDINKDENRFTGKIIITSENDNPLFKIAKESPLRLQGLVASVDFAGEKRFIKIQSIS